MAYEITKNLLKVIDVLNEIIEVTYENLDKKEEKFVEWQNKYDNLIAYLNERNKELNKGIDDFNEMIRKYNDLSTKYNELVIETNRKKGDDDVK